MFVDGATATPLIDQDGAICTPFATIQQAIDATTGAPDTWTIAITGGIYDEDLVVPADRRITMASMGQVQLGAVNPGNVTWTTGGASENYLQFTAWSGGLGNPGFGAAVDETTAGWNIGGTIAATGTQACTLCLEHVHIAGFPSVDTSGIVTGPNWLISRWSNIEGAVTDGGTTVIGSGNLRIASPLATTFENTINAIDITNALNTEFDGDVTLSGGESGTFMGCTFGGGVTIDGSIFDFDGVTWDVWVLLGNTVGASGAISRTDLPYEGSENTAGPITISQTAPVVFVDTSGGPITITLPAGPLKDEECKVIDDTGNASTNPITIDGNGNTINGAATDTIAADRAARHYKFGGITPEWKIINCCETPPQIPSEIFGADLQLWVRADDLAPGAVSAWNDRTANNNDFAQGTAANQPVASAAGGPNATAEVTFDGTNDFLQNSTIVMPAPGTTPFYIWMLVKQITWTSQDRLCQSANIASASAIVFQDPASPQIGMFNASTANNNAGAAVGSYKRLEAQFTNSTSDYLKVGSTNATGANAGNNGPSTVAGFILGASNTGILNGNISIAECLIVFGTPTAQQRAQLDAYAASRYGISVIA